MLDYERLKDAPTLKDLRNRLDEAIAVAGEDATWNGFDDEAIYIYPKRGRFLAIFPGKRQNRDIT